MPSFQHHEGRNNHPQLGSAFSPSVRHGSTSSRASTAKSSPVRGEAKYRHHEEPKLEMDVETGDESLYVGSTSVLDRIMSASPTSSPSSFVDEDDVEEIPDIGEGSDSIMKKSPEDQNHGIFYGITRREIVILLLTLVGVAAIAALVSGLVLRDDNSDSTSKPIQVDVHLSSLEKLDMITEAVVANPVVADYVDLPQGIEEISLMDFRNPQKHPSVRAMSWVVKSDSQSVESEVVARFALATLYYATDGLDWKKDDWLHSDRSLCASSGDIEMSSSTPRGWFGVKCNDNGEVNTISLTENGLKGDLPPILALIPTLQSLFLEYNSISGELDGNMFPPSLQFLYMQHNHLSGSIPDDFLSNGKSISTFFVNGNNLIGTMPKDYCPACTTCNHPLREFRLDCDKIECSDGCCDPELNCN
uniref:L domain-like protein n=1 Tax=Entomoneis paludosa TaxID=265537 RepID=A0A7S2VCT7_9STRA|mmetsp:Transcript_17017/g.35172  ORF Transcript_17017/g.35172 Transcript_17017/m.35172 type:complete len:417 (+) Transcript_17017:1407-2657(+)